jgi:hypothetical protein
MSAMFYLIRKEIKNTLLEMVRHPGRLILYLFVFALLIFSVMSPKGAGRSEQYADFRILHGAYIGILLLIGLPVLFNGLKNGATFFKMSDVNFLFVSPISSRRILAYGLVKQMGTSFLMMFFLLFYSATLSQLFGIVPWQMVVLVFGVALLLFTAQLITLLIYSFSNGRPGRIGSVKAVVYILLGAMAGYVLFRFFTGGSGSEALLAAISSPVLDFVPVFGWVKGLVFGIIEGSAAETAAYAVLNLVTVGGGILLFVHSNPDYYEDVLQSTESAFELRNAVKEGRSFRNRNVPERTIRVTDTGIGHGWGASVFFYKHLRQHKRKSRLLFVGVSTLVMTVGNVALGSFLQQLSKDGPDRMPVGLIMGICLAASSYVLFFFNLQGDWSMELMKPYIYLVPENPFSKLVWASLSTVMKPAVDGVVIFTVLGVFLHANPATAVLCIVLYASVGFLYVAVNVLSQRVLGQVANKGLLMLFYMLLLLLLFAPGAIASGILYYTADFLPGILVGLPIAVWDVAASLGIFAVCRNLLSTVEYNL